tara:strand:- start:221 stop:376 length:156 start_codon:yes stop_codon:yes gene_type:complete
MKTYLVTVSGTIEKQYLVEAKNEQEAEENYKNGEEGKYSVIEEFVVEVEEE